MNTRTEVNIGLRHIFSCELDDAKRSYIQEAFEEVDHIFADCRVFSEGAGYCSVCKKEHRIDGKLHIDLLLAGPSCKDLSISDAHGTYI